MPPGSPKGFSLTQALFALATFLIVAGVHAPAHLAAAGQRRSPSEGSAAQGRREVLAAHVDETQARLVLRGTNLVRGRRPVDLQLGGRALTILDATATVITASLPGDLSAGTYAVVLGPDDERTRIDVSIGSGNVAEIKRLRAELDAAVAALDVLRAQVANIQLIPGPAGPQGPQGERGDPGPQGSSTSVLDPFVTVAGTTIIVSGANLQLVNGAGLTGSVNGLGNLILGYNEADATDERTGSHNVVVGDRHTYASYGGLVAGQDNAVTAMHASVTGGSANTASAPYSTVSGGYHNTAGGGSLLAPPTGFVLTTHSSVTGGAFNTARGQWSTISGGRDNYTGPAPGREYPNPVLWDEEPGFGASVSGGRSNAAFGSYTAIVGGQSNVTSGAHSSVLGGLQNSTGTDGHPLVGTHATVVGGWANRSTGVYSSILGGRANYITSSEGATISGGWDNEVRSSFSHITAGRSNRVFADGLTLLGGDAGGNVALSFGSWDVRIRFNQ